MPRPKRGEKFWQPLWYRDGKAPEDGDRAMGALAVLSG
jgi:hypothetical protein